MTLLLLIGVFWLARTGARLTGAGAGESRGVVLIDSGHGGSDPGKIGIHQEKEKDINLQIANRLKKQLEKNGVQVYMTRETDTDLSDGTGGNSKVQDLKRRCELVRELQPDCVLSIHQNSYPEEAIHGAQVFYMRILWRGKNWRKFYRDISWKDWIKPITRHGKGEQDLLYATKKQKRRL